MRTKRQQIISLLFFLANCLILFTVTVVIRPAYYQQAHLRTFWSYGKWLSGDWKTGVQILGNIAMFVPAGFFLAAGLQENTSRPPGGKKLQGRKYKCVNNIRSVLIVLLSSLLFSLLIEILQFVLMRGLFECDDILNNCLGAVMGWVLFRLTERFIPGLMMPRLLYTAGALSLMAGLFVCFRLLGQTWDVDNISMLQYCFQIDSAEIKDDCLNLSGFFFIYEENPSPVKIFLRSTSTGKIRQMETHYGIERKDVQDYFSGKTDFTKTGFTASGAVEPDCEYEVLIKWPWRIPLSSFVYVQGENIHYIANKDFSAPKIKDMFWDTPDNKKKANASEKAGNPDAATEGTSYLSEIVEKGTPLVYRKEEECWIYQYSSALYWIAGRGFDFEQDGSTPLRHRFWTIQADRLAPDGLNIDVPHEKIEGTFEEYEIYGDFGPYRIAKIGLPKEYTVTWIVAGRCGKRTTWRWHDYFRPVYNTRHIK